MRPEQIFENFPKLYHMAWKDSWSGIKDHGLLSTKALLQLYEVGGKDAHKYINERRECWVEITPPFPSEVRQHHLLISGVL